MSRLRSAIRRPGDRTRQSGGGARGLVVGGGAVALALVIWVLAVTLKPEPVIMNSAEIATVWDSGVLRVGVRTDVPGMACDGEGLEIEVARAVAERIMSASPEYDGMGGIELVPVTSMSVASMLNDGRIDCAVAMMPRSGSTAYAYSSPYYSDPLVLWSRMGTAVLTPNVTVGYIQSADTSGLYVPTGAMYNALKAHMDAHPEYGLYDDESYTDNFIGFASYTDLYDALLEDRVDMALMPAVAASKYGFSDRFVRELEIGALDYAVAALSEKSAIAVVADMAVSDMRKDGTLDALIGRYIGSMAGNE